MSSFEEFQHLAVLLGVVEKLGYPGRSQLLTFRDPSGAIAGRLICDSGMIRFGATVQGLPLVDDEFMQEAIPYSPVLKRLIERAPLGDEEVKRIEGVPLLLRRVFRSLTARTLRRLAPLCDPGRVEVQVQEARTPTTQGRLLNFSFPLIELLLTAGRSGVIRYSDTAARTYEMPPNLAEQRWLFEWQPPDFEYPWPVMTGNQSEIKVSTVLQIGTLGYSLSRYFFQTQQTDGPRQLRAEIGGSGAHVYYLISTQHYFALIIYPSSQMARVISSLEELIGAHALGRPRAGQSTAPLAARALPGPLKSPALPGPQPAAAKPAAPPSSIPVTEPVSQPAASRPEPAAVEASVPDPIPIPPHAALADPPEQLPAAAGVGDTLVDSAASTNDSPAPAAPPAEPPASSAPAPTRAVEADPGPVESHTQPLPLDEESTLDFPVPAEEPGSRPLGTPPALPQEMEQPAPQAGPRMEEPVGSGTLAPQVTPSAPSPSTSGTEGTAASAAEDSLLVLRGVSAVLEGRTILQDLSIRLGRRGVFALMGPGGSGKSSLLGILRGSHRAGTGWSLRGDILYCGAPLGTQARPASVGQRIGRPAVTLRRYLLDDEEAPGSAADSARFVPLLWHCQLPKLIDRLDDVLGSPALRLSDGEWWRLAIARELLADPPLLCVDEPTAGLTEAEAQPILSLLRAEGRQRCVLMVSHNQQHVRECCDHVILLAAGQLQDSLPTAEFFEQPRSKAAQDYVRTGGCSVASPDAGADELEPDPPVDAVVSDGATLLSVPHPPEQPGAGVLWETPTPVLRLRDFGVRFGVHEVLRELNLDIAPCRIHLLVTPEGLAKRMLLRALCGAPAEPLSRVGQALYRGAPLGAGNLPALATPDLRMIQQSAVSYLFARIPTRESFAREDQRVRAAQLIRAAGFRGLADRLEVPVSQITLSEWRALDALSAASTDPALLCLDEPLSRLPPTEQEQLHELLCHLASFRALLIFVQDPTPYLLLRSGPGPRVGYLIDGTLSAERPGEEPAVARTRAQAAAGPSPPSVAGSGSAARPAVSEDAPEHPSRREVGSSGPRGFQWLREGALAGMPLPGLSASLDYDLGLLRSAGVTHLITLTTTPLPAASLSRYGLRGVFFPIEDMGAPPIDAAAELCTQLSELLAAGQVLCFHCKAGYGRTGTLLASLLVWEGTDARTALARVRAVNPNWVQSSRQETFLAELAERRSRHRSPRTEASTHTAGSARSPKRTA